MRFNDGRLDRQGRLWASTMVMDGSLAAADGALFRFDAQGLSAPLVGGLVTGNGLAFSPDGRRMYLSDSHPTVQRIWQFDLGEDGVPRNRRDFVDMRPFPGRPDGAAIDTEGGYWICGNDAGQIHAFDAQGQWCQSLTVPMPKPSMCAFGGADLDQMLVTSIIPAQTTEATRGSSGAVIALQPGVQGLPEPVFSRFPVSV
jgi:sugar lactone lactonase YvrE